MLSRGSRGRHRVPGSVRRGLGIFALPLVLGCSNLRAIEIGVCGNQIVEPESGETCDGFAPEGDAECRAPGEPNECRLVCSPGGPTCPSGSRCGTDGICRSSAGAFADVGSTIDIVATAVVPGDFDADGRHDLLATTPASYENLYFDSSFLVFDRESTRREVRGLAGIRREGEQAPPAVVAELSEDAHDDALLLHRAGALIARGSADRRLRFKAHTAVTLPENVAEIAITAAEVLPDAVGKDIVALGALEGASGLTMFDLTTASLSLIALLDDRPSDLSGPIVAAALDEADTSPCEELALPFRGRSEVLIVEPCIVQDGTVMVRTGATLDAVTLADGATIAGEVRADDVDGDGHADLVVDAERDGSHELQVAYGLGDGTFHSLSPVETPGDNRFSVNVVVGEAPIAFGDVDGDRQPDWVVSTEVRANRGTNPPERLAPNLGAPWTRAVIADLNANGHVDVLASADDGDVTFFNNRGDLLSRALLPDDGALEHARVGDFDGDLVNDVATILRTSPPDHPPRDTLAIYYGQTAGAPVGPLPVGEFDEVLDVSAGRGAEGDPAVEEGTDDLLLVGRADEGTLTISFVTGESSREMRAAFGFTTTTANVELDLFLPDRLVTGDFDGDGHADIGCIGPSLLDATEVRLWLVPVVADGRIPAPSARASDPLPPIAVWGHGDMAAVDLDADDLDELLVLSPTETGSVLSVARSETAEDGARHWVLGEPMPLSERFEHQALVEPTAPGDGRLRIADVDDDGDGDALALVLVPDVGRRVVLLENDGGGSVVGPEPIPSPGGDVVDFAVANFDQDSTLEVLLLVDGSVYVADELDGAFELAPDPVADAPEAHLVEVADLNGDGVVDLVLVGDDALRPLRGVPLVE